MTAIEWKAPPAEAFMSDRDLLVTELKKRPGAWARIQKGMKAKTGVGKWKALGLEVIPAPAESDPKRWDIYARAPEPAQKTTVVVQNISPGTAQPGPKAKEPQTASKKTPLVAQKVTKARPAEAESPKSKTGPKPARGDLDAQARVTADWRGRLGHGRG
ncbi:MAG: hypothetical protein QJR09_12035 [Micrococcus sp.]|nr:hypothetical protein [Micrococcus sp.]